MLKLKTGVLGELGMRRKLTLLMCLVPKYNCLVELLWLPGVRNIHRQLSQTALKIFVCKKYNRNN